MQRVATIMVDEGYINEIGKRCQNLPADKFTDFKAEAIWSELVPFSPHVSRRMEQRSAMPYLMVHGYYRD